MRVGAIVQARMSSARLPGKVLREVAGRPLLQYLLERLAHARSLSGIVVATSREPEDDAIARFCASQAARCYRGDLANVARRFQQTLAEHPFDAFVRVNGDSPLIDPALIDHAVALLASSPAPDLVTNVFPRTFPPGQSVEVIRRRIFETALGQMSGPDELEHVTAFFYKHAQRFLITNFRSERDGTDVRMAVDTIEDLTTFGAVVAQFERPHWEYGFAELLPLYRGVGGGAL